jgi:hypothetical protein
MSRRRSCESGRGRGREHGRECRCHHISTRVDTRAKVVIRHMCECMPPRWVRAKSSVWLWGRLGGDNARTALDKRKTHLHLATSDQHHSTPRNRTCFLCSRTVGSGPPTNGPRAIVALGKAEACALALRHQSFWNSPTELVSDRGRGDCNHCNATKMIRTSIATLALVAWPDRGLTNAIPVTRTKTMSERLTRSPT